MRRARQTAAGIKKSRYVEWRALREIEVGVCDGMTYAQVRPVASQAKTGGQGGKSRKNPAGACVVDPNWHKENTGV